VIVRPNRLTVAALAALGANLALAVAAIQRPQLALAAVAAPAVFAVLVALAASDRSVLCFAGIALPFTVAALNRPIAVGPAQVFASDILVALAVATWLAGRLAGSYGRPRPGLPVMPSPLIFGAFALVVFADTVRGHAAYGASLLGEPLRLAIYALLVLALSDLTPEKALTGLRVVFYGGAFWSLLSAAYFIATGTSQTGADVLSTGGTRVLSLSVSLGLALALFLAVLSFDLPRTPHQRALDTAAAAASLVGIVLSFGRGTFIAVAVVIPLLLATSRRLRERTIAALPLAVPLVAVALLLTSQLAPATWRTLLERLQIHAVNSGADASVEWRRQAVHVIWQQVRSSPFVGVGFGKGAEFDLNGVHFDISQDPHNSIVWLAAGGGALLVVLFALMVAFYVRDAYLRFRVGTPIERVIVIWSVGALVSLLLNALAGPLFSTPQELFAVWVVLLLPGVTREPPRRGAAATAPR
jgi:O-antigen ligase